MKTATSLIFALLLAFAGAGCAADSGTDPGANNGNTVGNNPDGNNTTGTKTLALITATVPDGISGDFYFGDNLACEGVNSCEAEVTGTIMVTFKCPQHLFLPKVLTDPKKDQKVTWDNPGDWGLAPSGTYRDEKFKQDLTVSTSVEGQQILLDADGEVLGAIAHDQFSWKSESGTYTGTVSVDLKTITYHNQTPTGNEFDITLTLVE